MHLIGACAGLLAACTIAGGLLAARPTDSDACVGARHVAVGVRLAVDRDRPDPAGSGGARRLPRPVLRGQEPDPDRRARGLGRPGPAAAHAGPRGDPLWRRDRRYAGRMVTRPGGEARLGDGSALAGGFRGHRPAGPGDELGGAPGPESRPLRSRGRRAGGAGRAGGARAESRRGRARQRGGFLRRQEPAEHAVDVPELPGAGRRLPRGDRGRRPGRAGGGPGRVDRRPRPELAVAIRRRRAARATHLPLLPAQPLLGLPPRARGHPQPLGSTAPRRACSTASRRSPS